MPATRYTLFLHPARHSVLDHDRTDDPRIAHGNEDGRARMRRDPQFERNSSNLIRSAAIKTIHAGKLGATRKCANPNSRGGHPVHDAPPFGCRTEPVA